MTRDDGPGAPNDRDSEAPNDPDPGAPNDHEAGTRRGNVGENGLRGTGDERSLVDDRPLWERVRATPGPAAWLALTGLLLLSVEFAALVEALIAVGSIVPPALSVGIGGVDWLVAAVTGALGAAGWVLLAALGAVAVAVTAEVLRVLLPVERVFADLEVTATRRGRVTAARVALGAAVVAVALAATTGLVGVVESGLSVVVAWLAGVGDLPTLLSRELIPNRGYRTPDGTWHGTFLGLSPALAWGLRVALVYAYAALWLGWLWRAFVAYREHYRPADWTPTDDAVDTLRTHRWGQFGLVIIAAFVVMAVFAPALGPTTVEQNIARPYSHEVAHFDEEANGVETVLVGRANDNSRSEGSPELNVGPLSYDDYDRFHPFGTLPNGKDLFTFVAAGARVSLTIGLVSAGLSALLALIVALTSAYYKGLFDLTMVVVGDTLMGVPRLLVMVLLTVLFGDTWIAEIYDGGLLLALILAGTGWPYVWRSIRGPALQIVEEEWVDAARSFGQTPANIMRIHMAPYVVGYLLIYFSMVLGGVIIAVAGLTFLGLGITSPTPEWGRAVNMGQDYVASVSWHVSLIPGVLITLVVVGFNAVGDGVRDAIDPQIQSGEGSASDVEGRGGGA